MDAQELLATEAQVAYAVLGRGDDFALIPLHGNVLAEADAVNARQRGLAYCGLVALKDGMPFAEGESDPDSLRTMTLASLAFMRRIAHLLVPEIKGDSVAFLEGLWKLPDARRQN